VALQTFLQACGARLLEGLQLKLWESKRATAFQMQKGWWISWVGAVCRAPSTQKWGCTSVQFAPHVPCLQKAFDYECKVQELLGLAGSFSPGCVMLPSHLNEGF